MPFKDPEKRAAWHKANHVRRKKVVNSAKEKPCADCGIQYPYYVMQFDHVTGKKTAGVSRLKQSAAKSTVLKEIEKCEVVCANCHAERSFRRLTNE